MWESETGLTQVWLNGKPSSRKTLFKGGSLTGPLVVVLGQDQDAYGGRFSSNDALIGQLTAVHMWDRVISPCEVQQFTENKLVNGGNMINWEALDYSTYGDVIEEKQIDGTGQQDCALA
ncbi:C-reactive protein-like [Alosa sapidissima]|uniref:C-reactive protein-like n=1 Tax=Alosa sapidissima TaxID=34773 RepID=UPI001C095C63|nr:C-reactive protein-like [Alosa sapidissima]